MSTHHRSEPKSSFGIIPPYVPSSTITTATPTRVEMRVGDTEYKDGLEEEITISGYKGEDNN